MSRNAWRIVAAVLVAGLVVGAALVVLGMRQARAMPVVRTVTIAFPDLAPGTPPIRLALLSDIHVGNAATPPDRLARIVAQINAARPDAVALAGDFVNADYSGESAAQPALLAGLAGLRAPLGVFATLGNHDNWTNAPAVTKALRKAGVTVLANSAARMGPFVIEGIDDSTSGKSNTGLTRERARRLGGIPIVLTHSPAIEGWIRRPMPLMLAGHTHCGQAAIHLGDWTLYPTDLLKERSFPAPMRCGVGRVRGMISVVTAGIGSSAVPMRLGAPPDWWLITLAPAGEAP